MGPQSKNKNKWWNGKIESLIKSPQFWVTIWIERWEYIHTYYEVGHDPINNVITQQLCKIQHLDIKVVFLQGKL
jgi:hypothetical protein